MVKIEGLKLAPGQEGGPCCGKGARLLRCRRGDVLSLQVLRRSVDAREELRLVYTAAVELRQEKAVLRRVPGPAGDAVYAGGIPAAGDPGGPGDAAGGHRGRAGGLFAALVLAGAACGPSCWAGPGRHDPAAGRGSLLAGGPLNTESNVQFGEGGAGAFPTES